MKGSIFLIALLLLVSHAMAEAVYENDVLLEKNSVSLTIFETYNLTDASEFRASLDSDNDSQVTEPEVSSFKGSYLASRSPQFMEYVKVDDGNVTLYMDSVTMNLYNATGKVTQDPLYVSTTINYGLTPQLGADDHFIWVMGHPLIERMRIQLPKGAVLVSSNGLENMTTLETDPVLLEGKSGIRSFMADNRSTFEYATTVEFRDPYLYEHGYVLPFLLGVELLLIILVLHVRRKR
ncbi:hypothetical protein Metho_0872 [Methanomethylovorans hollandica DSM 15978]|uniref:Uncharacterized protein n=1 Tax=Methanomethylovorans hollandica (strain DSM 15978 / NBRC 107637 / DMS1) TaxID=867904 RepID=L0KWN6_METHD|nr:hypothetical protein [Methanomethylovorans hollandica]AGB49115.1 hypothetical protein Metho_0872 [Methanomethylovorans hollandica DSM 15978]